MTDQADLHALGIRPDPIAPIPRRPKRKPESPADVERAMRALQAALDRLLRTVASIESLERVRAQDAVIADANRRAARTERMILLVVFIVLAEVVLR